MTVKLKKPALMQPLRPALHGVHVYICVVNSRYNQS